MQGLAGVLTKQVSFCVPGHKSLFLALLQACNYRVASFVSYVQRYISHSATVLGVVNAGFGTCSKTIQQQQGSQSAGVTNEISCQCPIYKILMPSFYVEETLLTFAMSQYKKSKAKKLQKTRLHAYIVVSNNFFNRPKSLEVCNIQSIHLLPSLDQNILVNGVP